RRRGDRASPPLPQQVPSAMAMKTRRREMPGGSKTSPYPWTRLVTCCGPRAICRRRWRASAPRSRLESNWPRPIPEIPNRSATSACPVTRLATCWRPKVTRRGRWKTSAPRSPSRSAWPRPTLEVWQRDLANANVMIGAVHLRQKEEAKAMDAFQRALDIYGEMIRRNPDDEQARLFSAVPLWGIGTLMGNRGGKELEEALAILKPRAETDKLDANKLESIPEIEKQIASLKKGWRK